MRILHTVEAYLPEKNGMSEVVRQLSERLVENGHEVVVATSHSENRTSEIINGVQIRSFKIRGNFARGISGAISEYVSFLRNEKFDVITNFAAQQWATDLFLPLLNQIPGCKVFVPTGFSGLDNPEYEMYYRSMPDWMRGYDMNVFLSNNYRDVNFAREHKIEKLTIIPNGASKEEFFENDADFSLHEYLNIPDEYKLIIHVGSYTGIKGHDEALEIFLRSNVSKTALVFIGQNFKQPISRRFTEKIAWFSNFSLGGKMNRRSIYSLSSFLRYIIQRRKRPVFAIPLNRQQLVASYKEADLLLFPSKIECSPIVIFEAMASKTPYLVTDVGNSREIVDNTNSGQLLPTEFDEYGYSVANIKESSRIFRKLLNDDARLKEYGMNGYRSWYNNFTWEEIAKVYEDLYVQLINKK